MARTLVQIRKQIESLEKEAESVRSREVADVIARIKKAIEFYELAEKDLFEAKTGRAGRPKGIDGAATKKVAKKKVVAKYKDPASGKTWTGHGKRPGWFLQAIESGKKAEDLSV